MRLQKTLSGIKDEKTPMWFMRQAGRYLPEYRALRSSEPDFISYCLNSPKAAEATLQPALISQANHDFLNHRYPEASVMVLI